VSEPQQAGPASASFMDGVGACLYRASRTKSRRDDETTLPRMTGDAGLLMSTTTSEFETPCVVT
jgi:hypothetical protein